MKRILWTATVAICVSGCMFNPFPTQSPGTRYPSDDTYGDERPAYPDGPSTYPDNRSNYPGSDRYGRPADSKVRITDIRLTERYTVLYVTYRESGPPRYNQQGRQIANGWIAIHPSARLIAANGAREFSFIRAEGIPVQPQRRSVYSGDQVAFVLYFERLDKGLENFDLFECSDYDQIRCWNVYDLFVRNPADRIYAPEPSRTEGAQSRPEPVVSTDLTVTGTVRDVVTKRPLSATIQYQLAGNKETVDSVQSFASTGTYRMNLQRSQVYTYTASARGYLAVNGVLDLSRTAAGERVVRDILLKPLVVGDKITLQNIYFEMSKADLLPASYAELNRVVTMMGDNPNLTIRLEGHTDIIGDKDKNLTLSRDRVNNCRRYLISKGIGSDRIQAVGYGDTRPITTKGNDEDRKVNRRVEFVILTI